MSFDFGSISNSIPWNQYKAIKPVENISLQDAQKLVKIIAGMRLPTPSLWLGTEGSPLLFSPAEFLKDNGPVAEPLNWKLSWYVPTEAPESQRDPGKEEYAAADFARSLQLTSGNPGALGAFTARVFNSQSGNQSFMTDSQGALKLLELNPEAVGLALREIMRRAQE